MFDPEAQFKNFHRNLCLRFGYCHDETNWWRDLSSLEEHIASQIPKQPSCQPTPKPTPMIDIKKKYRCEIGYAARIYATDGAGNYPFHGAYQNEESEWILCSWDNFGRSSFSGADRLRLVEITPPLQGWVAVFRRSDGSLGLTDRVWGTYEGVMSWAKGAAGFVSAHPFTVDLNPPPQKA